MQQFEITVKNDKVKYYKSIALLLVLFNMAVFIYLLIAGIHFYEAGIVFLFSGLYIIYHLYESKKNQSVFFIRAASFFILAGSWLILQNYLLAFACITLGSLYYLSLQKLQFVFNDNFVMKLNFPKKEYAWEMIENVILRDNILTIDLKDNTLIQLETESSINETQFNEFARRHLYGAGPAGKQIIV